MAVLRPYIMPTVGIPQPVIASRRPRNMTQQSFFQQQQVQPQQMQQPNPMAMQSTQQTRDTPRMPEFEQGPLTGEFIQEQLTKLQQRPERPMLEPGARVKSANAELVQPSTFQVYYEQLAAINQSGQEMLGAEVARSAFKRAQALAALQNQQTPEFGGVGRPRRGGSGGPNPGTNTPLSGDRAQARSIMQRMAQQWGWTGREWDALVRLIMKESGFNPRAANPTSSARGLFQKMVSIHGPLESTIEGQIMWGFNYIKGRYGSPSRALQFHLGHNWY